MIRIVVNGTELDLPTGMQMERELETTVFNRETEATDFVYPTDLPLTDRNLRALGNPDVIAKAIHNRHYNCQLIVDGIFAEAVLYIENVDMFNRTVRISINGDYGGFWLDSRSRMVNELELGGIRTVGALDVANEGAEFIDPTTLKCLLRYTPCTTTQHVQDVMDGTVVADYLFYPAVDETANIPLLHEKQRYQDMTQDGAIPGIRSIINPYFYNGSGDHGVIDPVKAYIETTFHDNFLDTHDRYFWVPFFKLAFVIKKCFTELGYTVISTVLEDEKFNAITLYNTYSINRCTIETERPTTASFVIRVRHMATQIDPRNHVPRMSITDFLREVGKNFNLQYIINYTTKEVRINIVNDILPSVAKVYDITNKVDLRGVIDAETDTFTNGYHFKFENDPQDGAIFEKLIEGIEELTVKPPINDTGEFGLISSPLDLDIVFVVSERAWYQYLSDSGTWNFFGYDKPEYKTSDNNDLQEISSKAVPVPSKRFSQLCRMEHPDKAVMQAPHDVVFDHDHLLPYSKLGMEGKDLLAIQRFPNSGIGGNAIDAYGNAFTLHTATIKPYAPHLCNYLGFAYPTASSIVASHPCGSSSNRDAQGQPYDAYGLYWYGTDSDDSLYHNFWQSFVTNITNSIIAEFPIKWDTDSYRDMNIQNCFVRVNSSLFLVDRANYTMPFPATGKIRLVKWG